jgi:F-type H+-transporting ATPase subunit epsilon
MAQRLNVTVVTPEKNVQRGEVDQVVAPSVMGQVGILPNHRPLLAALKPGIVELWSGTSAQRLAISGGFIEVQDDNVELLVDTAERAEEVDLERAKAALAKAEEALKTASPLDPEYPELLSRVEKSRVRLQLASMQ